MVKEKKETRGRKKINLTENQIVKLLTALEAGIFSLEAICKQNPDFPHPDTIRALKIRKPEFGRRYSEAINRGFDNFAESMLGEYDKLEEKLSLLTDRMVKRILPKLKIALGKENIAEVAKILEVCSKVIKDNAVDNKLVYVLKDCLRDKHHNMKWFLCKRDYKHYGDKVQVDQVIKDDRPKTFEEFQERKQELERRIQNNNPEKLN